MECSYGQVNPNTFTYPALCEIWGLQFKDSTIEAWIPQFWFPWAAVYQMNLQPGVLPNTIFVPSQATMGPSYQFFELLRKVCRFQRTNLVGISNDGRFMDLGQPLHSDRHQEANAYAIRTLELFNMNQRSTGTRPGKWDPKDTKGEETRLSECIEHLFSCPPREFVPVTCVWYLLNTELQAKFKTKRHLEVWIHTRIKRSDGPIVSMKLSKDYVFVHWTQEGKNGTVFLVG